MAATERFAESARFDSNSRARLLDPLFAPTNYDEYLRSLKQIQNQNESDSATKNDNAAELVNLGNNSQGRDFQVSKDGIKYTVEAGDSLWSIVNEALTKKEGQAPAAWKTLATLRKIAEKNHMDNPDLIHPGDVIDFSVLAENEENSAERRPPINTTDGAPAIPQRTNSNDTDDSSAQTEQARRTQSSGHSPRDKWYISQERDGDTGDWFACAPTSLLMALADYGLAEPTEANRQKLIRETGTDTGRIFPGASQMMSVEAQKRGLKSEYKDTTDWREVDAQIARGRGVIVNGTMENGAKHFVYISGKDSSGNYIVGDPANNEDTWTVDKLRGFISRQPGPLGFAAVWR